MQQTFNVKQSQHHQHNQQQQFQWKNQQPAPSVTFLEFIGGFITNHLQDIHELYSLFRPWGLFSNSVYRRNNVKLRFRKWSLLAASIIFFLQGPFWSKVVAKDSKIFKIIPISIIVITSTTKPLIHLKQLPQN